LDSGISVHCRMHSWPLGLVASQPCFLATLLLTDVISFGQLRRRCMAACC